MTRRELEYIAIGIIVGLTFGMVAGLLVAPDRGAATRRRIGQALDRAADSARTAAMRAEEMAEIVGGRVDHYLGRDEEAAWQKVKEIREGVQRYTRTQTM